jgi:hypothetical protein
VFLNDDDDEPLLRGILLSLKLVALGLALLIVAEALFQYELDTPQSQADMSAPQ